MGVVDDLIATAQPRTVQVSICNRGELVAAHAAAIAALGQVIDEDSSLEGPNIDRELAAVRAIEREMEGSAVTFTLSSVSRDTWATLLADNPPTREQRRVGHDHHPVLFPPAAVAACIVDPPTTVEQVKVMASERPDGTPVLPAGEWNKLWVAALNLNVPGMALPKLPAATESLRANGQSSTTSHPEASLEDGFSDDSGEQ